MRSRKSLVSDRATIGQCSLCEKIDRDDVLGQRNPELLDGNVLRILLIRVERAAVHKCNQQPGVVRARRSDHVFADGQLDDALETAQRLQAAAMFAPRVRIDVGLVLEADEMNEHRYNSSPSISSSATSTTML